MEQKRSLNHLIERTRRPTKPKRRKAIGSKTVEPIREPEAIQAIKYLLKDQPRNLLLFTLGINNGLRVRDLIGLTMGQLNRAVMEGTCPIVETKTGKPNTVHVNDTVRPVYQQYLEAYPNVMEHHYVFANERTGKPIGFQRGGDLVMEWCKTVGLKGRYGAHTLRKTWAYQQRVNHNTSWSVICARLNHSNPSTTRTYLGIEQAEVSEVMAIGI